MTDANQSNGAARTRRWFRRPWVLAVAATVLIALGIWANHLLERAKGRGEVDKRLAVLHAMGVAVTPAELAAKYPDPPPEKDARRLLQPGLAQLNDPGDGNTIPYFGGALLTNRLIRLSAEHRAEAKSYLGEQAQALSRIPDVSHDGAWFGSGFADWETHIGSGLRRDAYRLVKVLHLMALLDIEDGRSSQAVRHISRAQAVGAAIRSDIFVNHVFFITRSSRAVALVERLLNKTPLSEGELQGLAPLFTDERPNGFRNGLEYLTLGDVELLFEARRSSKISLLPRSGSDDPWIRTKDWFERLYAASKMKAFSDDEFCLILEVRAKQFEALAMNPAVAVVGLRAISKESTRSWADVGNGNVSPVYPFLFPFEDTDSRLGQDLDNRARIHCTRVAIAIERYRLAHANALPGSLAGLMPAYLPEVPLDLFDGQPLRFRKLPKGYVVYSIGRDLTDDGGKEPPADPKPDDRYDVTFTVERPE